MHETNVYRTILGGVSRGFRTPLVDSSARSLIFWHLKMGTSAKSAHFQVPKNETLSAQINQRSPKTFRGFHSVAIGQVKLVGAALARQTGSDEREVTSQLFQRLSLQLMRGNAALLSARSPDGDVLTAEVDGSE